MNDDKNGLRKTLWAAAGVVLAGLVLQTGGLLWWAGGMDARMKASERCAAGMAERIQVVEGRLMRATSLAPIP